MSVIAAHPVLLIGHEPTGCSAATFPAPVKTAAPFSDLITHKHREDPLSERRRDLFVADRCLFSIHVQVKVLRAAGQEALQSNHTQLSAWLSKHDSPPSARYFTNQTCTIKHIRVKLKQRNVSEHFLKSVFVLQTESRRCGRVILANV